MRNIGRMVYKKLTSDALESTYIAMSFVRTLTRVSPFAISSVRSFRYVAVVTHGYIPVCAV